MDPDYLTVLNYWIWQAYTIPDGLHQMWQNQLVVDRKASGAWAKTDALYVFANVNSQLTKTNWKSPGNNNATEVNAPTFTADVGYKGNGTSAYIDTNFDLSVDSVNYTLDSSSYGLYQTNTVTANGPVMSATNLGFTNRSEFTQYTTGLYTMSLNSSEISGLLTAGPGFWQVNRSVSTDIAVYKDWSLDTTIANASTGIPDVDMMVGGRANTAPSYSDAEFGIVFIGADLSSEAAAMNTAVQTYMSNL